MCCPTAMGQRSREEAEYEAEKGIIRGLYGPRKIFQACSMIVLANCDGTTAFPRSRWHVLYPSILLLTALTLMDTDTVRRIRRRTMNITGLRAS